MRGLLTLVSALVLGAAASASVAATPDMSRSEAQLAKALQGRTPGQPVSCINLQGTSSTTIVDGVGILYRAGSKVYLNRPRDGANWLDDDDILVTRTIGSQLCRLDTVTLIDRDSRIQRGFVVLGDFVPYTRTQPR